MYFTHFSGNIEILRHKNMPQRIRRLSASAHFIRHLFVAFLMQFNAHSHPTQILCVNRTTEVRRVRVRKPKNHNAICARLAGRLSNPANRRRRYQKRPTSDRQTNRPRPHAHILRTRARAQNAIAELRDKATHTTYTRHTHTRDTHTPHTHSVGTTVDSENG